ncbi:hypothetical protein PMAC_003188 [Pneumocystis sp. 'macacae']|nr:hypothetical protein PMAC_003188 [Pneumocystis sp. 'macacae']
MLCQKIGEFQVNLFFLLKIFNSLDSTNQNLNNIENEKKVAFDHIYSYKSFEKRRNLMRFDEYINEELKNIQDLLHKIHSKRNDLGSGDSSSTNRNKDSMILSNKVNSELDKENHDLFQRNYLVSESYELLTVIIATYFDRKYTTVECVYVLDQFCKHINSSVKSDNHLMNMSFACYSPLESCKKTIDLLEGTCTEASALLDVTEFTNYVCQKENLICKYLRKICGNKLLTICEKLENHCRKQNQAEKDKAPSTTQNDYNDFENIHTIIVDEIVYVTETVYSTRTSVAFETIDCDPKDVEDCICTSNMAICPIPAFTLKPAKSTDRSETSLTSISESTKSRNKLKPSSTKTPDKNTSTVNDKECEITRTVTVRDRFGETITTTVTVSKVPKNTDNAQIEKSYGVRIEFQELLLCLLIIGIFATI